MELSTSSSLKRHKLINKNCLEIQSMNFSINEYNCHFCNKIFNSELQLSRHLKSSKICKLLQKEINEIKENHRKEINEVEENHQKEINQRNEYIDNLNNKINKLEENHTNEINELKENHTNEINKLKQNHKDEINQLEQQISNLETANEIYKKISDKPTSNTVINANNNNKYLITNNFTLIDDIDKIKDIIDSKLTDVHVIDGQKGIAKFALESIISDEDGYLNYICSDSSRNIFKYKNSEGVIQKDAKAIKLTNALVKAGIKSKSVNIAEDLWTKEDGKRNDMKYEMCNPGLQEIIKIKSNNTVFRNTLSDNISS
jgi:DNA repair exonuclease SbcCD ATPase subunit